MIVARYVTIHILSFFCLHLCLHIIICTKTIVAILSHSFKSFFRLCLFHILAILILSILIHKLSELFILSCLLLSPSYESVYNNIGV